MTAESILALIDAIRPNIIEEETKLDWIYTLEKKIHEHMTRYGETDIAPPTLTKNSELLLDKEYAYMYAYYGVSMIDLGNQDIAMYNNSSTFFNDIFENWQKRWRREHIPQSVSRGDN